MELLILEHSYRLNEVISRQIYKTQALAALVIKGDGAVDNFQEIAAVIAGDVPALAAFLLAPGGIVVDAYPLEENPAVIGLNFFDELDHDGNREAILARDTGELVMGGPFVLRSGIMGLTGRYPVYIDTGAGSVFWGMVAVSLKFPEALDSVGLSVLEYKGLSYEIWRINPDTNEKQVIATNNEQIGIRASYIERTVNIHHAQWYFRLYPLRSWYQHSETWLLVLGALSISLFVAFVMQTKNTAMLSMSEQIKQNELELANSRISIMISQIRPHFIYNSLVAIKSFCRTDPGLAAETVGEFANYLRHNIDSLSIKEPIIFEKELSHVETYLSIEKKRFGEKLNVIYDISAHNFSLPALTLQPIVENAVCHGITQRRKGGTVTVTAREENEEIVIIVADDGVGFDTGKEPDEDGSIHAGIKNVSSRLAVMVGGKLEIKSEIDKGTVVVITIPKREENHANHSSR